MTSLSPAIKGKIAAVKAPVVVQQSSLPPPPSRDVAWIEIRSQDGHCQFFTTTCHPLVFMDAVKTDFIQFLTIQCQQRLASIRQAIIDAHNSAANDREGGIDSELMEKLAADEASCMKDTQWLAAAEEYQFDLFDSHTHECIGILNHKADDGQSLTVQTFVRGGFAYDLFTKESSEKEFHPLPLSSAQT